MRLLTFGALSLSLAGCASSRQGSIEVQSSGRAVVLEVTDSTAVVENGHSVRASQLAPGEEVRASYRLVDGEPQALRIEATRRAGEPPRPPRLMQRAPGDQGTPDDPGEPPPAESGPPPLDPHLTQR